MSPIDRLIEASRERQMRVAVIGDAMEDVWLHGAPGECQEGCQRFDEHRSVSTPGGAANAARQLCRWNVDVGLISMLPPGIVFTPNIEGWNALNFEYVLESRRMPRKTRFVGPDGRVLFRHDLDNGYGMDANAVAECRRLAITAIRSDRWDAVLISDYDKGFLDGETIHKAIQICNDKGIPVVADAKRPPSVYAGAIIKSNDAYVKWHRPEGVCDQAVITCGPIGPRVGIRGKVVVAPAGAPVQCVNHVGAGDAFAAHLTLALAHSLSLEDAAAIAHSAGRVYVQHPHGRPPFPHEIRKDRDPAGGKVLAAADLPALRKGEPGRVVFTNGCFRVPAAGHVAALQWAKAEGDVLVVGVNSDASARRQRKEGAFMLPIRERVAMLSAMEAVDWVIVFDEDDPCETIKALRPDVLVKGAEYCGRDVPGSDLVEDVRFAPMVNAEKPARLVNIPRREVESGSGCW